MILSIHLYVGRLKQEKNSFYWGKKNKDILSQLPNFLRVKHLAVLSSMSSKIIFKTKIVGRLLKEVTHTSAAH